MARNTKNGQEDLRQRRSKRHMSQALLSLMEERPFKEISVVDICDRAMVHRTTFYAHFEDKNALLRYVLGELRRSFMEQQGQPEEYPDLRSYLLAEFRTALTFLKEHRKTYLSGLAGGPVGMRLVETELAKGLADRFREEDPAADENSFAEISGQYYAGAILSLIRWWLEQDDPMDETELIAQFRRLLPTVEGRVD